MLLYAYVSRQNNCFVRTDCGCGTQDSNYDLAQPASAKIRRSGSSLIRDISIDRIPIFESKSRYLTRAFRIVNGGVFSSAIIEHRLITFLSKRMSACVLCMCVCVRAFPSSWRSRAGFRVAAGRYKFLAASFGVQVKLVASLAHN